MELTHGLHRARRLRPHATALVCEGRRLTFAAFVDRIARLAAVFCGLGVGRDDRVAILAPNGQAYLETLLASFWCGGIAVPINARFALPEMVEQVLDAEPSLLVLDESFAEQGMALRAALPSLRLLLISQGGALDGVGDYETEIASAEPIEDARRGGQDLACIFYTGGTTGRSKGVMLTHASIWANATVTSGLCGFDESLVHLHAGPLFHLGAAGRVFTTVFVGGCHVVLPRFTPEEALAAIERERVTASTFVPTMLGMILDKPEFAHFDLSSLRLITYGASPMPEAILRRCIERFPGIGFLQSYGMTELSPVATVLTQEDHQPGAPARRLRSAGRPVVSAEVKIADPQGQELPSGEVGEILVRGPMVMKGYWRQPELTAETLRGGWMHTGDAGFFDEDGYLYVTDRLKDMIITGGENVYSVEVENALHTHPAIAECAVIGLPDPRWGERVHAVIVLRSGHTPGLDEIVAHCRGMISGYKVPRTVEFHPGPLPLSSVNKINKAALRAAHAERNKLVA